MKRKAIFIVFYILFALVIAYLQFGRKPTINNSIIHTRTDGYKSTLSVTMNKLVIINKDWTTQSLLCHVQNNDFSNMELSYDVLGYPTELELIVYANALTYRLNLPAFHFKYTE